jgi:predicted nucleic acid-binding protein
MVLIDTSVWIRSFSGQEPFFGGVDQLAAREEVAGHELVYGELLVGDIGGRQKFLEEYALLRQTPMLPHADVVHFVRARRLHGRGIGWVDVHLLASALVSRSQLWTADPRLARVAAELGVAYRA